LLCHWFERDELKEKMEELLNKHQKLVLSLMNASEIATILDRHVDEVRETMVEIDNIFGKEAERVKRERKYYPIPEP